MQAEEYHKNVFPSSLGLPPTGMGTGEMSGPQGEAGKGLAAQPHPHPEPGDTLDVWARLSVKQVGLIN